MLLERDGEMAALRSAMTAAGAGEGGLMIIAGPPGMGKTGLLAAAVDHARATGLRVLAGCGRELEREIALGVAVELLAPPVAAADPEERPGLLAGPAAAAAPLVLGRATYPAPDSMLLGLCWLAANLAASAPLLMAVDDAQWADAASLRFLAMLADRASTLPLVLVIAVRDGAEAPRLLLTHPKATLLRPAPLSGAAVGHLVAAAFPAADDALVDTVGYASGGNPFLVGELLRSLQADGGPPRPGAVAGLVPGTVLRSVLARMARLPADTAVLATSIAVLGDGTPLSRAATHAGLDLVTAEHAADRLATACLVRPGNPLTFAHPLIGAAVHADLPPFARSRAHRRAADLLSADRAGPDRVAGHLLVVEPEGDPWVVDMLRDAADTALRRGDPTAAARLLTRALAEPPSPATRGRLLVALARAQLTAGDPAALASLTEGLDLLDRADRTLRAQAFTLLAQVYKGLDDPDGAVGAWEAALELYEPGGPDWQDVLAGYLTTTMFHPATRERAERHLCLDSPPASRCLAAHVTLRLALAGEPPGRVLALAEHALADDPLLEPGGGSGALMALVVHALVIAGELVAAEQAADAALTAAGRRGDILAHGYASYHRALARLRRGRLAAALADLEAAQLPYTVGWTAAAGWNGWLAAQIYLEHGDLATAHQVLRQADERPADSMETALASHVRAQLALARGDSAAALDLATTAGLRLHEYYGVDHPGLLPWRTTAALAARHAGDHDQAQLLAAAALDRAHAVGISQAVGTAQRVAGLVARPTDITALTEATATLSRSPAALEHARALADLGTALRRSGDMACRQPLRQALAIAEQAKARPLADRVRSELHALGIRPRRTVLTGVDALTPAEGRVALLASHGMSNRQIAQTLFITAKTVETHLARAYRKLAITNRAELAGVLTS
ncbi:MAG TPA: AAA family ATPase [Pseudonocardiaceae bacterium]|nr:AAA family ATPase [Pseudonocardiaceae bacterium]